MRIKLTCDIPVNEKHGLIKGRILETVNPPEDKEHLKDGVWIEGVGEKVRILSREYEIVD